MTDSLQSLMLWAVTLTGYPLPDALPKVETMPHQALAEILCAGKFCNAVAYYDPKTQTIYYDDRMQLKQERNAQGFIVHEMVHYLQHKQNADFDAAILPCEQRMQLEREAYRVQRFFLREHKYNTYQIDLALTALSSFCNAQP